jgi:hypothetical protein
VVTERDGNRDFVPFTAMSPYASWALVALCFALGVAYGSVSNPFAVFVPSLQSI